MSVHVYERRDRPSWTRHRALRGVTDAPSPHPPPGPLGMAVPLRRPLPGSVRPVPQVPGTRRLVPPQDACPARDPHPARSALPRRGGERLMVLVITLGIAV